MSAFGIDPSNGDVLLAFYYGGAGWGITVGAVPLNQFSQIVAKRPVGLEFLLVK
jgi:glutamine cyclotransferase